MNKLARLARSEIMFEKIRDARECEPRLSRTNIRLPKNCASLQYNHIGGTFIQQVRTVGVHYTAFAGAVCAS